MSNSYDEMIATNIDALAPPSEPTASPMATARPQQAVTADAPTPTTVTAKPISVPRSQQAISAVTAVQPQKTPTLETAPPIQGVAPPTSAGGNLVPQGSEAQPMLAVQTQQPRTAPQTAPQAMTPISTLKQGT